MAATYTTREGDTAELIAWKHYGTQRGMAVEQLLEANPGLADYGPVIPAGVNISLPELVQAEQSKGVRLWD